MGSINININPTTILPPSRRPLLQAAAQKDDLSTNMKKPSPNPVQHPIENAAHDRLVDAKPSTSPAHLVQ